MTTSRNHSAHASWSRGSALCCGGRSPRAAWFRPDLTARLKSTSVSGAELAQRAFGHDYEALERTIDVHVMNLRRKIEPDRSRRPAVLVTVFGTGYRLEAVRAAD